MENVWYLWAIGERVHKDVNGSKVMFHRFSNFLWKIKAKTKYDWEVNNFEFSFWKLIAVVGKNKT